VRRKLAISIGIISLAILGGLLTSHVAGGTGVDPPPPLALADQESMPVGDENGPMVCDGKTVTAGYVREQVLKVETLPPEPSNQNEPTQLPSPTTEPPQNPIGEQAVGPWYVFRCINDKVVAIPVP
jgi:hypothetical protein